MESRRLRSHLPMPNDRNLVKLCKLDAKCTSKDDSHFFQGLVAASKPSRLSQDSLIKKNEPSSSSSAGRKISDERRSCQVENSRRNIVRTFPSGSLMASPKIGASGSTKWLKQSGKPGQSQWSSKDPAVSIKGKEIQKAVNPKDPQVPIKGRGIRKTAGPKDPPHPFNTRGIYQVPDAKDPAPTIERSRTPKTSATKDPAPPINRSGTTKTSVPKDPSSPVIRSETAKTPAPGQVWSEKAKKSQPSAGQAKSYSEHTDPVYHITWDGLTKNFSGFDVECESVGRNCHLCNKDLSCVPRDDEIQYDGQSEQYYDVFIEHCFLSAVDILPCGHAFHSECLQAITPEEQFSDPPCFLCLSMA